MTAYSEDAYRYAIRNAYAHHGKADMGALVGKLKALYPDANPKELIPICKQAVEKVNGMGMNEISQEYEKFEKAGFELKIPEKKVGLQDLEWAGEEGVVTRFAPNPSAPPHLGHVRAAFLSYAYAKKYGGKFILRFDDTDPKLKKPMEGAEKIFFDELGWLGIVPDMVVRASDRLEVYYDYMQQLVGLGQGYICSCDKEEWKKRILQHEACPCRELPVEEQQARLQKMFKHEYKQGEAVLRIKTDLDADDPSQRDWPCARIVDKPQHYNVKDKYVWPTYNFACGIDDHLLGITLIIRGQEHVPNMLKQQWLFKHFGWNYPHAFHYGRIIMPGTEMSKSKMIAGIAAGKYIGWDDPRLFTLRTLMRRGITPEGIRDLMIELGVKTSDTILNLEVLATYNKPHLTDAINVPLIENPIQLEVDFGPSLEIEMDNERVHLREGNQGFFISQNDLPEPKVGNVLRLRNAYIVKLTQVEPTHLNAQFVSTQKLEKTTQVSWVLQGIDVRIVMPTNTTKHGLAGHAIRNAKVGQHVFFPGFGYCRVDAKDENSVTLWFTHP
ncbi:MAG: glutamate--tRNA ligase [Candidatus Iainarchaeum archaeon]|uniref:Glutamate--tRNA ligase n=1 Tax=Candidatus Iainarchaeum sp. TaxID=3101447 RepID=A0A7T9DKU4_9ARCH|nr:MAG: glutamate--tRNA ligase [Candidatus Diapherotrites archaeon]